MIEFGITAGQLTEVESLVAYARALKTCLLSLSEVQESYTELDEQADRVEGVCREIRRQGS